MKSVKPSQKNAMLALEKAVRKVIDRHIKTGQPLAAWQNGKVRYIPPRKALRMARESRKSMK